MQRRHTTMWWCLLGEGGNHAHALVLVLRFGNPDFTDDLQPGHGNTFHVTWRYRFHGGEYAIFDENALGKPAKLDLAGTQLHFERA